MLKRICLLLLIALLTLSFVSCAIDDSKKESSNNSLETSSSADEKNTASEISQGEPVQTFTVDWPCETLPADFPDLGKVTEVYNSSFVKKVTVNWNIVTEDQVNEIVDKLNAYLDYDHVWQGTFYSDGLKYKSGTEDESVRVVIRYMPSASGKIEPELDAQLYLEISGEGLPDKK